MPQPPAPPLSAAGRWVDYGTFTVPPPMPTISDTVAPPHGPHTITDNRGLFVLHAVLMHTGKVLVFSGHVENAHYATESYVLTVEATAPNHTLKRVSFPAGIDLFCCHYVQIADGKILAVGGSDPDFQAHGSRGARTICTFDPVTETWERKSEYLAQGRWYPTAVLLGDGRVLVFSGRRESHPLLASPPANIADAVEVIHPPSFQPHYVTGGATFRLPLYPGLHLAPNGRIYYTHTNWGLEIDDVDTRSLEITGETTAAWTPYSGRRPNQPRREEAMSVLLPPASAGKILLVGGSIAETDVPPAPLATAPHTPTVRFAPPADFFVRVFDQFDSFSSEILDTTVTPPTWTNTTGAMSQGRTNGHLVLLPDRSVLVCGGHDQYKWRSIAGGTNPSLETEAYQPASQTFELRASLNHPRMYHSIALLLPDGRVLAAGGADPNDTEPPLPWPAAAGADPGWNGPRYPPTYPLNRKDFEVFEPPYMHSGPRPEIDGVQKNGVSAPLLFYGDAFQILTTQAGSIRDVAFMRPGAPTHHTDSEQRYVEIPFTLGTNVLNATVPTNRSEAPPGYYMLWIVDTVGRPCTEAKFILLAEPPPPAAPAEEDDEPWLDCVVVTVALGSPAEPGVVYLQGLRAELAETTPRFIAGVNRAYYAFSPALATWLAARPRARSGARDALVRPAIAAIAAADAATRPLERPAVRHGVLVALLLAEAALALLVLPLLLVLAAVLALREEGGDAG